MPCSHYDTEDELRDAKRVADRLTRLLCRACEFLEDKDYMPFDDEVASWWKAHKQKDEDRKRRETAHQEQQKKDDLALAERLMRKWRK